MNTTLFVLKSHLLFSTEAAPTVANRTGKWSHGGKYGGGGGGRGGNSPATPHSKRGRGNRGGGAGTGEAATAAARTKNKCTPKVRKEFPG